MAVSQDNVQQRQPGPTGPEHAPVHDSDARSGSSNRTPKGASATHPSQRTAGGEARSVDVDLSQALEQQITQAIQPMLDEFRQRMSDVAQELSAQVAAMPIRGTGQPDTDQEAPQGPDAQSSTVSPQQPPTRGPVPSAAPEAVPQQSAGEQALKSQSKPPTTQIQHVRERSLVDALTSAGQTAGRSSAQWLQSLLIAGLGALLAESMHATVQQRAEQGLHILLQKAFEAAPADFANQEMQEKAERTLQLILREALDAVFAEGVRTSVQQGGQQTIQPLLHGDFGGALSKVEETLQVLMAALIAVLRRHQQTILRLLLALVLLGVGTSLEQSEKAK